MSIIQLDSRIQMKKDTEANWTSNNPVLLDGETVISLQSDGTVRKKTGNGTSNYNQLNYDDEYALNNTTQQINTHNTSSNPHANMGWVTDSDLTASNVSFTPGSTGMSATDVQGAVTELFTSVSDGKSAIAAAITDKGVTTAADATFQQMANNILDIHTGGGTPVSPSDVNFYDYDGTLLYSYTIAEANLLTELPQPPTHDGLTFQEWNYPLDMVQATTKKLNIGATYITSDGKTRLYISVPANSEPGLPPPRNQVPLYFQQTVENGVTIDWGDNSPTETLPGTGVVNTTHTYETAGNFVISLSPVDGCELELGSGSDSNCVMGSTGENGRVYCNMLKRVEVGSSVTSIGDFAFYNCYSLSSVSIPDGVTSIGVSAFYDCYSLSSVSIPDGVTSIGVSAFGYCYGIKEYHCKPLTPPTLSNTNAFSGIPKDCVIYVPVGSLEAYKTATNWSTYASHMQEEPA